MQGHHSHPGGGSGTKGMAAEGFPNSSYFSLA
jgi:hypothetical protein